jgi:hypothetical protein
MGSTALPFSPIRLKTRFTITASQQVPGVLQQAEGDEEGGDDGEHDGHAVGQAHGDDPVLPHQEAGVLPEGHAGGAHQELLHRAGRDQPAHQPIEPRHQALVEHLVLQEVHRGLGAEDAHELVGGEEHAEQDRDPQHRVGGPGAQPADQAAGGGGVAPRHHRVVEPVQRRQALPRDHEP